MLFLRSWLEDYLELSDYSNTDLINLITSKSSEVEEIAEISDYFEGKILIGRIENSRDHPQADRLKIFDLNLGPRGKIQIVSAAPNVADGLFVPVALEGCRLPFVTIVPRKMRGEISEGMCLGKSELMLETEPSSGLWELNEILSGRDWDSAEGEQQGPDGFLGKSICEVLPEFFPTESLIDIKVLPDKIGTIGNHIGMAIDLAICMGDLTLLKPTAKRFVDPNYNILNDIKDYLTQKSAITITFDDKTGYTNHFWLFDLKIQKSNLEPNYYLPHQFIKRMFLTQRHLVGGLADLSNYLLTDTGQPTHFFSQEKTLTDGSEKWEVRQFNEITKFKGLGQLKDIDIPVGVNLICDQNDRKLAIPAISGSDDTKTDFHEKAILLEIANFEANQVARNSFLLKQRSEGAKIWAGKVRRSQTLACLLRLIEVLHAQENVAFSLSSVLHWSKTGGNQDFLEAFNEIQTEAENKIVPIDSQFVIDRLDNRGPNYWQKTVESKLNLLGQYSTNPPLFNEQENNNHTKHSQEPHNLKKPQNTTGSLKPHRYYTELNDKYDLFLDISRLIGFDQFQEHSINTEIQNTRTPTFSGLEKIRQEVMHFGFDEVITRPFVSSKQVFDIQKSLEVTKAYRSQEPYLRDRLIYSLASRLVENLNRGEKEPKLFEQNRVYQNGQSLEEKLYLAGLSLSPDPYLLTSLGKEILTKASLEKYEILDLDQPLCTLGRGYLYKTGVLDYRILELGNAFKKDFSLPTNKPLWYFEFDLTNWDLKLQNHPFYADESAYPPIVRAYSLSIPKSLNWHAIVSLAQSIKVTDTHLFVSPTERLAGQDDQDILNFQVKFVNYDRTLKGDEVNDWQKRFVSELQKIAPVELR